MKRRILKSDENDKREGFIDWIDSIRNLQICYIELTSFS